MEQTVLVVYGSQQGSTAQIAEKIGETLRAKSIPADVQEASAVSDLAPYRAIVIGSSVYMGQWHKHVVRFMKENVESLENLPVWIFSSGPTGPGDPLKLMDGWFYPKSMEALIQRIKPLDVTCFGGKLELAALNPFQRFIINKVKAPEGDFRDWQAVADWVDKISTAL